MDTTHRPHHPPWQAAQYRRRGQVLLAVAGLALAMLANACDTSQQVPWASYNSQVQPRIDAAAATGNCAALQALLTAAERTSHAHQKATGLPNDALVSYIHAAQHRARCPAGNG
jgi:hypothetical protein